MLATAGSAVLLGVIPQGSALQGIASIPEIIWEAFLGLWLTFKTPKGAATSRWRPWRRFSDERYISGTAQASRGPSDLATLDNRRE